MKAAIFGLASILVMLSTSASVADSRTRVILGTTGQTLPFDSNTFSDYEKSLLTILQNIGIRHGYKEIDLLYYPLYNRNSSVYSKSIDAQNHLFVDIVSRDNSRDKIVIIVSPYLIVETIGAIILRDRLSTQSAHYHLSLPFSVFQSAANSYQAEIIGRTRSPSPDDALKSFKGYSSTYSYLAGIFLISPQTDLVPFEASAQSTVESCARTAPFLISDITDRFVSHGTDADFGSFHHALQEAILSSFDSIISVCSAK